MNRKKRIALFHPWIKSRGGAEKVVLELAQKSKHNIDIYTWAYDPSNTFPEFEKFKINVIAPKFAQKLVRNHILRGLFLPLSLFAKIPLERYDKFLISTSGVAEFITFRNYLPGKTWAYVHTPLREADPKIVEWNLENRYKRRALKKFLYLLSVQIYKFFEKIGWKRLDKLVFNSELTRGRARSRRLLGNKESFVVHPPIDYKRLEVKREKEKKQFVYFTRFNPPKRQDVLVRAWKKFSKKDEYKLILVGTSDNEKYLNWLKEVSKKDNSIELKINASDGELSRVIAESKAGIFLGYQEDLGITPLEILYLKKPLISVDEGGYVDLIRGNPLFFKVKEKHSNEKMVEEVKEALEKFVSEFEMPKSLSEIQNKDFVWEMDSLL